MNLQFIKELHLSALNVGSCGINTMDKTQNEGPSTSQSDEGQNSKNKCNRNRGKKRKRLPSHSSSDEEDVILPDNALATERCLHRSAVKNNLDDISVRKILKKVVTNDHVLALVKLREEEESSGPEDKTVIPKLTRAKVKELKKVSPESAAWNLENLELTPIKHIPVKTRPEVKALIAQELPEDEDDDEYEPTNDDVPSDDDHVLESSDLESQPRTPATPGSIQDSPKVVKDGPFKVPQDVSARRKLSMEAEATIALRTRSKLSLSSTSIEHIESNFVPPDDIPIGDVDDLWNEFLNECLNPASAAKNEEDDEADPEYNVAADADAMEEDEEALGRSIIKISKKELNDLVTELFNIMPETSDEVLAENLANSVLTDTSQNDVSHWEGKQEPLSDEENADVTSQGKRQARISIGKSEPPDIETEMEDTSQVEIEQEMVNSQLIKVERVNKTSSQPIMTITPLQMSIEEGPSINSDNAPPSLRKQIEPAKQNRTYEIYISDSVHISEQQILILQQQLRMHIQLATSNFLQLFVHPIHWSLASNYKEYLMTLVNMTKNNPKSVVDVCNLKPAMELVKTWEQSVSADTPENREMIEFVMKEVNRSRRRFQQNSAYVGEFHETFQKVVANSPVFLYPYLLPSMPYRADPNRRTYYLHSEDELIVLGLDQFWEYVDNNPQIFKRPKTFNPRRRWGLGMSIHLIVKHMFPWMTTKGLHNHISLMRSSGDKHNPIYRYFKLKEINKVEHKLLPYNPSMSLYEQPEHEMPRIWIRYLGKTSKRFRKYLRRRHHVTGREPDGIPVLGDRIPIKRPLPIEFTKQIKCGARTVEPKPIPPDKYDLEITKANTLVAQNLFKLVQTQNGAVLVPLDSTSTVNSTKTITTPAIMKSNMQDLESNHCSCCVLLRRIPKVKQKLITDYFTNKMKVKKCFCSDIERVKVSDRLKLLVNSFKNSTDVILDRLNKKLNGAVTDNVKFNLEDWALVSSFKLKLLTLTTRSKVVRNRSVNIINNFDIEVDDPVTMATQLRKEFEGQTNDLYADFLVFLNGEQAERLKCFKDYFIRNCVEGLMEKIEEQVTVLEVRQTILIQLKQLLSDTITDTCQMCTHLLRSMKEYPKLAEYTFTLFPHKKEEVVPNNTINIPITTQNEQQSNENQDEDDASDMIIDETHENTSGTEENPKSPDYEITIEEIPPVIKEEPTPDHLEPLSSPEVEKYNSSMQIVFEEESIKEEPVEWKRDEDKLILEILKQQLTPEERREKPLTQLLDEMNVHDIIADKLPHKTKNDIEDRITYLLSLLMLTGDDC